MAADWLRPIGRDAGLALRLLAQRPGFAAVALLTLALGIGAPTAIFSVVHAVLLRPLPYPEPDRIVRFQFDARGPGGPRTFDALPATLAVEWGAHTSTLAAIALFNDRALTLSTGGGPFRLSGVAATPAMFDVLGVPPALGRTFDADTRDPHQIVLSHGMWERFFAASPAVIGSSVMLDSEPYRVTGVMPEAFQFPTSESAFWVPLLLQTGEGRGMLLPAIARLRPEATVAAVVGEGRTLIEQSGATPPQWTLLARTLQEQLVGGVRRVLWILMAAVALVSAIATANIALLLLVRGASREREFSIRLALGAGRRELVRQLFVEALTLAVLGGAAGIVLAGGLLEVLLRFAPADMPRLQDAALSGPVLVFAVAATFGASVIFGILSAGRTIAIDPVRALGGAGAESRLIASGTPRRRLNLLAAGELALTMVLLVGAGLLLRSFIARVLVDQGFEPRGALALQISLPAARYPNPAARLAFHERLLERLKQMDGVEVAGLTTAMPNRQPTGRFDYNAEGPRPLPPDPLTMQIAEVRMVSEGFFEAMGIPLRAGRTFRLEDGEAGEPVMVISERLARLHFPDSDPIGQILYSGTGNRLVVGVVGDVRPADATFGSSPAAYIPMRQGAMVFTWLAGMNVIVRGETAGSLRALILSLDADMPPFNVRRLDDEVSNLVAGPRFSAAVLAVFALVALALAAIGVYGVMAYGAAQRTQEIGVRVALGATRAQVLRLILRDGVFVVISGLTTGLVAAIWLAQTLTGLLYDVQPADPVALVSVGAILSIAGLAAAFVPARRATRVSALEALRNE